MVDLEIWKDADSLKIGKESFEQRSVSWDIPQCEHNIAIQEANIKEINYSIKFLELSIEALKKNGGISNPTFEYQKDPKVMEANKQLQLHVMHFNNENGLYAMRRSKMLWEMELGLLQDKIDNFRNKAVVDAINVTK